MAAPFNKKRSNLPRRRRVIDTPGEGSKRGGDAFRRNRTLTRAALTRLGGSSDDNSNLRSSPRVKVHKLASARRKVLGVLIIVILATCVLWLLINQFTAVPAVVVSNTAISKSINKEKYQDSIQDYLNRNPLDRLRFMMDQTALTSYVSSSLSEVAGVKQGNVSGVGQTDFIVTMRKPVAGWSIGDKQYYVGANGVPFNINYFDTPKLQIIDKSGVELSEGVAVVSKKFLSFVGRVVSLSSDSNYIVTEAVIPKNTTRQLEIKLQGIRSLVKLSIDRSVAKQIEDMSRAVQYFKRHKQSPKYIDVRVSGKAFYL